MFPSSSQPPRRLPVLKTIQLVMINYCDCNGLNLVIFIITTICSGSMFFKTSHISMLAYNYMVNLLVWIGMWNPLQWRSLQIRRGRLALAFCFDDSGKFEEESIHRMTGGHCHGGLPACIVYSVSPNMVDCYQPGIMVYSRSIHKLTGGGDSTQCSRKYDNVLWFYISSKNKKWL